jgi:cell division protein FtsA
VTQLFEYITGMNTRVGYPTEHLANTNTIENLTSPIYSTGIGLVLKGFEALEKRSENKPVEAVSTEGSVATNPDKTKGKFFDSILKIGTDFFKEKDEY